MTSDLLVDPGWVSLEVLETLDDDCLCSSYPGLLFQALSLELWRLDLQATVQVVERWLAAMQYFDASGTQMTTGEVLVMRWMEIYHHSDCASQVHRLLDFRS